MFYVKIVDTDGRTWTWVGPFWIFTKGAEADAAAAMQAKTWKTRRGAEAFIEKLERDGLTSPGERIEVARV